MQTICEYLAYDHQRCDDLFLKVEASIAQQDWHQAESDFQAFCQAWLGHIDSEERIVFPAMEKVTFNAGAPLAMLRLEHQRMRGLVARLDDAVRRHDPADFLLHAETLTILAQQHGLKEEEMLYPLLDRILSGKNVQHIVDALREAIDARGVAGGNLAPHSPAGSPHIPVAAQT
ncbi:hemerythrin domain-containing protein [Janthinobacterium sp. 17J80-10]|uniref:hemerythrin domain-containing protein n=1 Tax=Janthinobacterium sp. 17J80-10 TaxID=2497863 RepID=UPI001005292B|nr:hemerythrin domain-containing protein [Janthinobacterium sp. 17J80-10]QAU34529.1 hemerythrin domain-containing protein [Janthinobacterium sp. 17J80-10]